MIFTGLPTSNAKLKSFKNKTKGQYYSYHFIKFKVRVHYLTHC